MINGSGGAVLKIYNKTTGATIAGPTALDSLGTGSCASGLGDPVVLYDQAAGRWLCRPLAVERIRPDRQPLLRLRLTDRRPDRRVLRL